MAASRNGSGNASAAFGVHSISIACSWPAGRRARRRGAREGEGSREKKWECCALPAPAMGNKFQ